MRVGYKTVWSTSLVLVYSVALLITSVCVFVPLRPLMPYPSLDSSWALAINRAVANSLIFGRDLIFTFGPYGAMYSRLYSPDTDMMSMVGSCYLAVGYTLMIVYLARSHKLAGLGFLLLTACIMFTEDALINTYTLLFALSALRAATTPALPRHRWTRVAFLGLLSGGLGLLIGIKASFIALAVLVCLASVALMLSRRRFWEGLVILLAPPLATAIAWLAAGQPLIGILYYLRSSVPIISGYTEAMSSLGDVRDVIVYLGAAVFLIAVLWSRGERRTVDWAFSLLTFAAYLFIAFKGGFVRQDGHVLAAGTSIIAAALALSMVVPPRPALAAVFVAGIALLAIDVGYVHSLDELFIHNFNKTYSYAAEGLSDRYAGRLPDEYNAAMAKIRAEVPLPKLEGTSDLYSYSLAYLLASDNDWSPRPVIQSYSAYTPWLQERNLRHLNADTAPDNIFFRVEAIDNHYPSLEDGPSWLAILERYSPSRVQGDTLILKKRPDNEVSALQRDKILETSAQIGSAVEVPQGPGLIYAEIHMHRSEMAKLESAAFKPPAVAIAVTMADGGTRKFRTVPQMMDLGFIISPVVENTNEFVSLFGGDQPLRNKVVKSVTISQEDGMGGLEPGFEIVLYHVMPPSGGEVGMFDEVSTTPPTDGPGSTKTCDGSIDSLDGAKPGGAPTTVQSPIGVKGWLALDPAAGSLPDAVYVTLTGEAGDVAYIKTRRTPRGDVADHFKQPGLSNAGFESYAQIPHLRGRYRLGLTFLSQGKLRSCDNLQVPVVMN